MWMTFWNRDYRRWMLWENKNSAAVNHDHWIQSQSWKETAGKTGSTIYLGLQLGPEGCSPNAQWTELIKSLPLARDMSTFHSFLGVIGFEGLCRRFCMQSSPSVPPTEKGSALGLDPRANRGSKCTKDYTFNCTTTFMSTNWQAICSCPQHPNIKIRAVLSQDTRTGCRLVAYASRMSSPVEQEFSLWERNFSTSLSITVLDLLDRHVPYHSENMPHTCMVCVV